MSFHKHLIHAVPIPYVRLSLEWIPIFVFDKRLSLGRYSVFQDVFEVGTSNILHTIIYNKTTRCNSCSIVFINNYKYALHVSDALVVHHQEHYKL